MADGIQDAQVVVPCFELAPTLAFFTGLGFCLEAIHPADDPRVAVVSGHGVRLRLEREACGSPGVLRLACQDPATVGGGSTSLTAPNGTIVRLEAANPPVVLPELQASFVLSRFRNAHFAEGRAGMRYRDLVPGRLGGRYIASHILIPDGGPVPDYVHFHAVAFQMIYCASGWVRVVYEDQGEPFVLQAGDCALQPPRIRHRVLESSPALEVIEVSSPAEHETFVDHATSLPTNTVRPERAFEGQRFVRHEASRAAFSPWRQAGFEMRDLEIATATRGLAGACVVRTNGASVAGAHTAKSDLRLSFVLAGTGTLERVSEPAERIERGDAFCVPAGMSYGLAGCSGGFEMLEVSVPGSDA